MWFEESGRIVETSRGKSFVLDVGEGPAVISSTTVAIGPRSSIRHGSTPWSPRSYGTMPSSPAAGTVVLSGESITDRSDATPGIVDIHSHILPIDVLRSMGCSGTTFLGEVGPEHAELHTANRIRHIGTRQQRRRIGARKSTGGPHRRR